MTEDDLSQTKAPKLAQLAKSALIESAATEVVSIGRALFKDGEPSDPELQRRYRLYKRLEAALALPSGRSAWRLCIRLTASTEQIKLGARPDAHWHLQPTPTRYLDGRTLAVALCAPSRAAQHVARRIGAPADDPRRKGRRCSVQAARTDNPKPWRDAPQVSESGGSGFRSVPGH